MKDFLIGAIIIGLLPTFASAHMGDMMNTGDVRYETMRLVEDEALGSDVLHEQMETLMERMMAGEDLSDAEIGEMATYMRQYPGVHSMMMGRYVGESAWGRSMAPWHTGVYGGSWLGGLVQIIWLLVGILALVWLARKIFSS